MKRTSTRAFFLSFAAICVVAFLTFGCKPSENPDGSAESGQTGAVDEGAAALESKDWARAYDKFSDAIAKGESDVDAFYGRATAALEIARGHYSLAQAAATNQDVKTGETEAGKADEYFQKALSDCDKVLELDAKFADAHFLKGVVAQYQGRWEDGIEAFSQCVSLDPQRADAYHHRGEIYEHIGDSMNSSVDFNKASELGYSDGTESSADGSAPSDFSDLNYDPDEGQAPESEAEAANE